ncbi:hypothetical protein AB0F30_23725 [Streptomyces sp. NPDC029006]|uniref:hypothetical protein n=1 Tax=Streptomyces sp. NPDC029006 TaxID=3155467 RepID=UPI0033D4F863
MAASCVRQGALPERLPSGLLPASRFAAGAPDHALPCGLGAHTVTLRFLRGRGVPLERATASIGPYSLVRSTPKTLVPLVFLAVSPVRRRLGDLAPEERLLLPLALAAGGAVAPAAVLLTVVRPVRPPMTELLRSAPTDVRVVHARPSRVLALWGGAAGMPLVQAGTLACVGPRSGWDCPGSRWYWPARRRARPSGRCPRRAGRRSTRPRCGRWSPSAPRPRRPRRRSSVTGC